MVIEVKKRFDEFVDVDGIQKCARVRCQACGFVRAKNVTRQLEHLLQCKDFLQTADGQALYAEATVAPAALDGNAASRRVSLPPSTNVWGSQTPKSSTAVPRPSPNQPPPNYEELRPFRAVRPIRTPRADKTPSLTRHLNNKNQNGIVDATENTFLSTTQPVDPMLFHRWFIQLSHLSRGLTSFIGALMTKIKIRDDSNLKNDSMFRALDLLCSAASNAKKEIEFIAFTRDQYDIRGTAQAPDLATQAFIDLFASVTSPNASFLQGMVVLWSLENVSGLP